MSERPCMIWGTKAEMLQSDGFHYIYKSQRAGGQYKITREASINLRSYTEQDKCLLTSWIVDQIISGELLPLVDAAIVEKARLRTRLPLSRRIDRFFQLTARELNRLDEIVVLGRPESEQNADNRNIYCAWTECHDHRELHALCRLLDEQGLIKDPLHVILTPSGYGKLEETQARNVTSTRAFAAMWFHSSMETVYKQGIEPAIQDCGFEPVHLGFKEHVNDINDEIIMELRRSRFVVADFTCGIGTFEDEPAPVSRGGVYYEAGYAHGLGIPVVWCCRADCIEYLHFDIRQYAHISWNAAVDLRDRLTKRIAAVIGMGPYASL